MAMKWHHFAFLALVVFVGYWLGEKYPGMLRGLPIVGQYT